MIYRYFSGTLVTKLYRYYDLIRHLQLCILTQIVCVETVFAIYCNKITQLHKNNVFMSRDYAAVLTSHV